MVTRRSEAPAKVGFEAAGENGSGEMPKKSDYEQSREERIKQNLERMQKLGILDLSLKLKSMNKPTPKSAPSLRRTSENATPLPPSGPRRRSSRLQTATPVNYSEVQLKKNDNSSEDQHDFLREEGSKPEFYTEEHDKLLGSTEMSWTLFVDGYASNGKRIYDPVKGKTCHQCRQKTLGHHTNCSQCNKVQGQFCGDCLYMRYGEHVLEANQNPNWICPVCRGFCNCSLCRQAKGWAPTGPLYKKISNLGFKSVAHYIIQTRQKISISEATSEAKVPISAKRSLPFSSMEETPTENESSWFKNIPEGQVTDNCIGVVQKEEKPYLLDNETHAQGCCKVSLTDSLEPLNLPALPETSLKVPATDAIFPPTSQATVNHPPTTSPGVAPAESTDSIARRLRPRRGKITEIEEQRSTGVQQSNNVSYPLEPVTPMTCLKSNKKRIHISEPSPDSIAGQLRQRRLECSRVG